MTDTISRKRSRNYLNQVTGAAVYKAMAMTASFAGVPIMINYLGAEQFGVWSTLLTIMSWIVFFDLGIGNGLRNKVAESLARDEKIEACNYVASGYTLFAVMALALGVLTIVGSYFVPWQAVFNTQAISQSSLRSAFQIAALFILSNFWVGVITALLGAVQKSSLVAMGQLVSNVLVLAFVFFLSKTTEASISRLAFVYGLSLVTANVVLSYWFYRTYSELRPRIYLNRQHVRPLLTVGLQFFIIQLAALVIFTTDKMLITQLFGPQYVTQYDVVFKLFSVITFTHGLISAPLWSAYTEAYSKNDFAWMRCMLQRQLMIFGCVVIAIFILVLLARPLIGIWIGQDLMVSSQLIIVMGTYVLICCWNNIYAVFVNGIGKIKLQIYTAVIAMLVNIPLSIIFSKKTALGVSGIVVGTICSLLLAAIALPLQVHRLVRADVQS